MIHLSSYSFLSIYTIIGDLVLAGFSIETLKRGNASNNTRFATVLVFILWIAFLVLQLSANNLFSKDISELTFCFILFGFVGAVCAVMMIFSDLRDTLLELPYDLLLLPQGLRVFFGAGFLIEGVLGFMPKTFSIMDGIFHITSAFLALKSGLLYARGQKNIKEVWFANLFGLTDIVIVALGISFVLLNDVGPNHNMMYAAFFAAPIFVAFHFISLIKLTKELRNKENY